jgi:excinuclease ABC subunit C
MYEVVGRRARRGLEEGDLPDLVVIDGGRGQLSAAKAALDDHGIDRVDIIALAKSRNEPLVTHARRSEERRQKPERVFVLNQREPIVLRQDSAELFLLTRIRDEAHRFAVTFQRQQRGKIGLKSRLDAIDGVGPVRRRTLLKHFGSLREIIAATAEQLSAVLGPHLAARIHQALHDSNSRAEP